MIKKTKLFIWLIGICVLAQHLNAQNFTIRGTIEDITNGEHLISAYAYDANTLKGSTSNYYGFYSLTLPKGNIKLTFSYAGYKPVVIDFALMRDTVINVRLNPVTELEEVVVVAGQRNIARENQMGLIEMTAVQTKQLPVFMGEADIMKTIQLLPGVKGGTEGTSGFYVRGGGPDQNLILLDGVPVYNAMHLFGFFSVFNSDAIQSFTLYKGGFPARYGGRLSSVMDIKMKEGNNKKFGGEASLGLISSKITFEGPIVNDQTSFILSARRTYIDVIPILYMKATNEPYVAGYYFYDINAKVNHKVNDRNRLYISFYNGLDKAYVEETTNYGKGSSYNSASLGWGNSIAAIRWNYVVAQNLFCNSTTTFSNYNFFVGNERADKKNNPKYFEKSEYSSGITDWTYKLDFDYIPSTKHYVRFGGNYTNHLFSPGVNTMVSNRGINSAKIDTSYGNYKIKANEFYLYIEDDIEVTDKLKINAGTHFSIFNVKGRTYNSFQPRFLARYLITGNFSAKASVVNMKQYIHLLASSNIGLPTDLWVPATDRIKPMESWQTSLGLSYSLNNNYEFSIEGYYKPMFNIIEYKEGASFFSNENDWENKVESGKGWGKGIEFLVNKKQGKWTGWIGYTLSYADRQFEEISFGKKFPYKFDRRHDIGLSVSYKKSERFDAGLVWVYGTGNAVTLPEVQYAIIGGGYQMVEYFENRNAYRMPAYHRMDLGFNFHKKISWGMRTFSFGAYNAYNRQNPFYLGFDYEQALWDENLYFKVLKQYSILPLIPFVKYSIKF